MTPRGERIASWQGVVKKRGPEIEAHLEAIADILSSAGGPDYQVNRIRVFVDEEITVLDRGGRPTLLTSIDWTRESEVNR